MRPALGTLLIPAFFAVPTMGVDEPAKEVPPMKASVQVVEFGKTADGTPVDLYTLTNASGMKAKITNYGGIVTELHVLDRCGHWAQTQRWDAMLPGLRSHFG